MSTDRILLQVFSQVSGLSTSAILDLVTSGDIAADHVGSLTLLHRHSAIEYLSHHT